MFLAEIWHRANHRARKMGTLFESLKAHLIRDTAVWWHVEGHHAECLNYEVNVCEKNKV